MMLAISLAKGSINVRFLNSAILCANKYGPSTEAGSFLLKKSSIKSIVVYNVSLFF
jgi:hypothetical protein